MQDEGLISEELSYKDILNLQRESKKLEQILENDSNFESFYLRSGTTLRAGDIIITNSTSSTIIGHAGIAISSTDILYIGGFHEKPAVLVKEAFKKRYSDGWIKVYRLNNSYIASQAAIWENKTYYKDGAYKNVTYSFSPDLMSTSETYCSKIVFHAYYIGGSNNVVSPKFSLFGLLAPYAFPSTLSGESYNCSYVGDF